MFRSYLFTAAYWLLSVLYVLISLPFLALPGRGPVTFLIRSYTRSMRLSLRLFAGLKTEAHGKANLPDGPFIVAAKHQSWGDGFLAYSEVPGLVFVTGDHLERFPLVGGILKKLGAIVIDTCGGGERKAASLTEGMLRARDEGQRVLIYPEGHLAPIDHKMKYKSGVWHMYQTMDVPVVPVATNLGYFWPQEATRKRPGTASIEFLDPIPPGLAKTDFMDLLEERIESRTADLIAKARGGDPVVAVQLPDPPKGEEAKPISPSQEPA